MKVEIEIPRCPAEATDIDDPAEDFGRLHILVGNIARYLVDDQVDTFAAGGFKNQVDPARVLRIDGKVGTEFCQPGAPFRVGR